MEAVAVETERRVRPRAARAVAGEPRFGSRDAAPRAPFARFEELGFPTPHERGLALHAASQPLTGADCVRRRPTRPRARAARARRRACRRAAPSRRRRCARLPSSAASARDRRHSRTAPRSRALNTAAARRRPLRRSRSRSARARRPSADRACPVGGVRRAEAPAPGGRVLRASLIVAGERVARRRSSRRYARRRPRAR